jgi:hypothetical protein
VQATKKLLRRTLKFSSTTHPSHQKVVSLVDVPGERFQLGRHRDRRLRRTTVKVQVNKLQMSPFSVFLFEKKRIKTILWEDLPKYLLLKIAFALISRACMQASLGHRNGKRARFQKAPPTLICAACLHRAPV